MKRIFIILMVVLVIVSMFSISFAKTFADVKNTKYEKSVDLLSTLGIVDGYQDGTYKPNNTVTRAELAKLIIVTLGKEKTADALKGKTDYFDVVENSWASGYINCASDLGIIKGYPDGSFKPSNSVSYVEASTMLLRALNYTKELETEKYPTGYMKKANDAGILKNVTANSSSDAAIRGNIANMMVNTLMANTRKIVSTNSNGTANYGDSTPLIEENFKGYTCVKNGVIVDIDFDNRVLTVRDKANSRKEDVYASEDIELEEMYMRQVDFLYDDKEETFWSFDITDKYTVKEVDVEEIKKGTVYDKDDNEYDIPDDELMVYVFNYDEVETAYITYDEKKIIGMVLIGTPTVYAGIVTETGLTVDGRKGFEYQNPDGKYKEIALSDTSEKLSVNTVILFSLDNNDRAIIHNESLLKNAVNIEELSSNSIKLKKADKISLTSDVEFYVYLIDTEKNIREGKLKDIEEEFDQADTYRYAEVYYIIVFEDSVDDDEIVSKLSVSEATDELEDAIKAAKKLINKESSYSVATFEPFREAYEAGVDALDNSSSAAKLELAAKKINDTRNNLKSATSEDKKLRSAFADLQAIIKEGESKKSSDYTAASFKALTDALKSAKAVKLASTTTTKINDQISAVRKAINMLVTNTANDEIQNAINYLKSLITKGDNIVKNKADYTEESFNRFNSVLTSVKKFDTSSASLSEIKNQSNNLEAAIDALELKLLATYTSSKSALDKAYNDAKGRKSEDYTEDSFNSFKDKFDVIKDEYEDLHSASEVEELSNGEIQAEINKINDLTTRTNNALKLLVSVTDDTTRNNLKTLIAKGEAISQSDWTYSSPTFAEFTAKLKEFKALANNASATEEELSSAIAYLVRYVSF